MEDFLKFLLIAGVVIIGIAKEVKKNKSKKPTGQRPIQHAPSTGEMVPDAVPMPEAWGEMFPQEDIFQPVPIEKPAKKAAKKEKPKTQMPEQVKATFSSKYGTLSNIESEEAASLLASSQPADEDSSDYSIRSAEEARRAIIWGEILQRKY